MLHKESGEGEREGGASGEGEGGGRERDESALDVIGRERASERARESARERERERATVGGKSFLLAREGGGEVGGGRSRSGGGENEAEMLRREEAKNAQLQTDVVNLQVLSLLALRVQKFKC